MDGAPAFAIVRGTFRRLRTGGRGSLKIDLDLAHGAGDAVDRIPIEVLAIDAVGRRSLGTVQGDAHIVQFGVAVTLVLHRLGGVQGIDGVAAPGLRVGKALGRLLDGAPQAIRQVMAQPPSLPPAIDEEHRDRSDQGATKDQDPEAQASRRHSDSQSRNAAPFCRERRVESARPPGSSENPLRPYSSSSHSLYSRGL